VRLVAAKSSDVGRQTAPQSEANDALMCILISVTLREKEPEEACSVIKVGSPLKVQAAVWAWPEPRTLRTDRKPHRMRVFPKAALKA